MSRTKALVEVSDGEGKCLQPSVMRRNVFPIPSGRGVIGAMEAMLEEVTKCLKGVQPNLPFTSRGKVSEVEWLDKVDRVGEHGAVRIDHRRGNSKGGGFRGIKDNP